MKTLLVRTHDNDNINSREIKNIVGNVSLWPALGLLSLGAMLKKHGHEVEVLDAMEQKLDSEGLRRRIAASGAGLVGITATTPGIRGVVEAAGFAHEAGARVVIGGPHTEIYPEETLSLEPIDYIIRGDGEVPLLRLVEALQGPAPDLARVPGLLYKTGNGIAGSEAYVESDLDSLPMPDWSLVNIRAFSRADALSPLASMVSGRGCPNRCGFCHRGESGKNTRFRNPLGVADEMEYLVKSFGVREIVFCNDTLTLRRDHILELCSEILRRNLKVFWQGATRVDAVDPEMLKLMKRAGCRELKFGIESGSARILELMHKRITREKAMQAVAWCRAAKIRTGAYYILGYAREDETSLGETIAFARDLGTDFAMFYAGVPLPCTGFHDLAVQDGKIDPDYWRDYVLGKRSDRLPALVPDMDKWLRRAFWGFYARPGFLVRKLTSPGLWLSALKRPALLKGLLFPKSRD